MAPLISSLPQEMDDLSSVQPVLAKSSSSSGGLDGQHSSDSDSNNDNVTT